MSDRVAAHSLTMIIGVCDALGIELDRIFAGLELNRSLALDPESTIAWSQFVTALHRVEDEIGEQKFIETVRTEWPRLLDLRPLALGFKKSRAFFLSTIPGIDATWPCVKSRVSDAEDGRLRVELRLDPGLAPSRVYWLITIGALEYVPVWMGLPRAEIEVTCTGVSAVYLIRFPDDEAPEGQWPVAGAATFLLSMNRAMQRVSERRERLELEQVVGRLSNAQTLAEVEELIAGYVPGAYGASLLGLESAAIGAGDLRAGEAAYPMRAGATTLGWVRVRQLGGFREGAFEGFVEMVALALEHAALRLGLLRRREGIERDEKRAFQARAALETNLERVEGAAVLIDRDGVVRGANEGGKAVLAKAGEVLVSRVRDAVTNAPTEALVEIRAAEGEDGVRLVVARGREEERERKIEAAGRGWGLTKRQTEVLGCVVRGLTNKEIARELGCAEITVENHVTQLLRKARVGNRAGLVGALAAREGEG